MHLFLLLVALAAGDPAAAAVRPEAEVVAEIGPYRLTRAMLDATWESLPPSRRAGYEKTGGKALFLQDLIDQKLIAAEAERRGYLTRPALAAAVEVARDGLLYRALYDDEVTKAVATEEAMRNWYGENRRRFAVEETARIRHILVTPHRDNRISNTTGDDAVSDEEAKAKVERLRREIVAGADFAEIARRFSEDVSAPDGGRVEDFARGKSSQPIEDAAFTLAAGQVSEVLRTPYGYHLIRVEARIPAHVRPFEEVRDEVARALLAERRDALRARLQALTRELRDKEKVVIRDPSLAPEPPRPPDSAPAAGGTR